MKVIKKEAPKEEVKVTNVFGDEYDPEEHELDFMFIDDCPAEELEEDIAGLAKDIIEHEDVLHMLGEKLQAIEDNQLQDIANLSDAIDVMDSMQKANKMMLDVIIEQDKRNDSIYVWFVIWQFVLTILVILIGIHVFF